MMANIMIIMTCFSMKSNDGESIDLEIFFVLKNNDGEIETIDQNQKCDLTYFNLNLVGCDTLKMNVEIGNIL